MLEKPKGGVGQTELGTLYATRNVAREDRVSGRADWGGARQICKRKVVPAVAGGNLSFWANMMSLATRCGALSPYLQATKHKAKNLVLPGVKEFVPTAGKAKHRYEASNLKLVTLWWRWIAWDSV